MQSMSRFRIVIGDHVCEWPCFFAFPSLQALYRFSLKGKSLFSHLFQLDQPRGLLRPVDCCKNDGELSLGVKTPCGFLLSPSLPHPMSAVTVRTCPR